jgi:hypothetical protein
MIQNWKLHSRKQLNIVHQSHHPVEGGGGFVPGNDVVEETVVGAGGPGAGEGVSHEHQLSSQS